MINIFNNYVSKFDMNDKMINHKYYHSLRVMEFCGNIAQSLNLKSSDVDLAMQIGLLHDIGRFYQETKYKSLNDNNEDHAIIGNKILFEDNEIDKFNIMKKNYLIISKAILNHNALTIDESLNEREMLFAKIVRDADKLDILNNYTLNRLVASSDESTISEVVKNIFLNDKCINGSDINTNSDRWIQLMSFVYDINYQYSFKYLKDRRVYESLKEKYGNKILNEYFDKTIKYIEERSEEKC